MTAYLGKDIYFINGKLYSIKKAKKYLLKKAKCPFCGYIELYYKDKSNFENHVQKCKKK